MLCKLPKMAYDVLDEILDNSTMTQKELSEELDVDGKSIKYAIRRLQEHDLVYQIRDLMDMRLVHYRLPTGQELQNVANEIKPELVEELTRYVQEGDHQHSIGIKSYAIYRDNK